MVPLATEKPFGQGQEELHGDPSNCREKLLVPTTDTQALAFANENLWLARHAGSKMQRWHLDDAVRQVGGMLTTDSRGIFDALTRSESPQLRLRSARTGEEARGIKEQCPLS